MMTQTKDWNGYRQLTFSLNGRDCLLVLPHQPRPDGKWIWRAEFFGAFDTADRALLEQGWAVAYCCVSNMYGCPEAVEQFAAFQSALEREFGLSPRAVLFGFSRGGLYAVNYAAAYPRRVSALYLDAPVLDIRSWPGGKGAGVGDPACWRECLACYGLTEETAAAFAGNPLDKLPALAGAGLPILLVAGDADDVVPYAENGAKLARRYRELGGVVEVILKPGVGHHPHSLEDPRPSVDFILGVSNE